jgi:hypothetical protein
LLAREDAQCGQLRDQDGGRDGADPRR